MKRLVFVIGFSSLAFQCAGLAINTFTPEEVTPGPFAGLEVGTRILSVGLSEDQRGTGTSTRDDNFLGTIDRLDVDQDLAPTRLYAQYFFSWHLGAGVSWDKVEADANDGEVSDGTLGIQGPLFYLVGRIPTISQFTPFVEAGLAFYHSYFDENTRWATDPDGNKRHMEIEDPTAFFLGIGCDYNFTPFLSANLYFRLVEGATMDGEHFNSESPGDPRQTGEFNLDYTGFGIGIKYAFE